MCAESPNKVRTNLTEVEFSPASIGFRQNGMGLAADEWGTRLESGQGRPKKASLHTLAPTRCSEIRPELRIRNAALLHLVE